jgi:polysaccharide export outer membrane protein
MGTRDGKPYRVEVDVPALFLDDKSDFNVHVKGGDSVYVGRAAMFYDYGEVQRPGAFRLERNMTVMQGLAQGGGVTTRGSEKSLKVYRHDKSGKLDKLSLDGSAALEPNDVIYVPESLF